MEEEYDAEKIRKTESEFLKNVESRISSTYIPHLFEKYKQTLQSVSSCYKNQDLNLEDAKKCADKFLTDYQKKEKQFEALLNHQEVTNFIFLMVAINPEMRLIM